MVASTPEDSCSTPVRVKFYGTLSCKSAEIEVIVAKNIKNSYFLQRHSPQGIHSDQQPV